MLGRDAEQVKGAVNVPFGQLYPAAAFAGARESTDGFYVMESNAPQLPPNPFDAPAEQAALEGERELAEGLYLDEDIFGGCPEILGLQPVEFGGPVVFFGLRPGGSAGE